MDHKLNEFMALTQGSRTVLQYAQAFNDLCQYAGYHADTDEKKRDRFRRGLNTKLRGSQHSQGPQLQRVGQLGHLSGGLHHSSPGREEEEDPCGRAISTASALQDCVRHSE